MSIIAPTLFAPGQYDSDAHSELCGLSCGEPSRTQQHLAHDQDINVIMSRFVRTGELPQASRLPTFGDFNVVTDYQTALNALNEAKASFMSLPPDVRLRFGNDPHAFLDFTSDPSNLPELKKLGLLSPEAVSRLDSEAAKASSSGAPAAPAAGVAQSST